MASAALWAGSAFLPWWAESESFGSEQWVQRFSPWSGVTGSCTPGCDYFGSGPPTGPIHGTSSFAALGLTHLGLLYHVSLILLLVGAAAAAIAAIPLLRAGGVAPPGASGRLPRYFRPFALLCGALAASLLAILQPGVLNADVTAKFSGASQWTASPSPETSFWGGCVAGPTHGACAGGGSAVWGPGLGWDLMVVGVGVLVYLLLRYRSRPVGQPSPNSPVDST